MNPKSYPLAGWILTQVEGKSYLGNNIGPPTVDGPVTLSPVYEFQFLAVPTPQGVAMQPTLRSPWGCTSIASLTLPRPGVWVALDALSDEERHVFAQLVAQTEEGLRQARAAAAGILLAPAGAKLPPMQPHGNGRPR